MSDNGLECELPIVIDAQAQVIVEPENINIPAESITLEKPDSTFGVGSDKMSDNDTYRDLTDVETQVIVELETTSVPIDVEVIRSEKVDSIIDDSDDMTNDLPKCDVIDTNTQVDVGIGDAGEFDRVQVEIIKEDEGPIEQTNLEPEDLSIIPEQLPIVSENQSSGQTPIPVKDQLLERCIGDGEVLPEGTLVWAQCLGSIFWPACIISSPLKDDEDNSTASETEDTHDALVIFVEPRFRLGSTKWSNVIAVDLEHMNQQKDLIIELNKNLFRKKGRKTPAFDKSYMLLVDLVAISPSLRIRAMESKFAELSDKRKTLRKSSVNIKGQSETKQLLKNHTPSLTSEVQDISSESVIATPQEASKSISNQRLRLSSLRQNLVATNRWSNSTGGTLSPATPILQQDLSDVSMSSSFQNVAIPTPTSTKKPNISKFTRPRSLGGEALRAWTIEKFEKMDKSMKFASKATLSCAKCKLDLDDESELVTCHDYPFHKSCLSENSQVDESGTESKNYKCVDCVELVCFICKKGWDEVLQMPVKCSGPKCDLLFHRDCLIFNWPQAEVIGSSGMITCPLHFCHGCKAEHFQSGVVRDYRLPSSKAIRCLYCLSTYHKASCIPAGAGNTIMKNQFLICPRHSAEKEPPRKTKRLGCFSCKSKLKPKDSQVNCTLCPFSFHSTCVHGEFHLKLGISLESFKQTFRCEGCLWGMFPRYGQMVWFQQPGSVYWPSMILYTKDGVGRGADGDGQFSVGYCGYPIQFYDNGSSRDCVPFELGVTHKEFLKKLNFYTNEKVAEAAQEGFHLLKCSDGYRDNLLPKAEPIFKRIERNMYRVAVNTITKKQLGKRKSSDNDERCGCAEAQDPEAPTCTADSGCFNRDTAIECNSTNCSGKDRCQNRMFTHKKYNEHLLEVFVSPFTKGWGLKAKTSFPEGTFICEYLGEVISKEEVIWRVERKADDDPLYFLEVDTANFIDAEYYGNLSRLINHSCDPNCRIVKYSSSFGKRVIGIFTKKDIDVGEELTFDYNYGPNSTFAFRCRCNTANCKGVIGSRRGNKENLVPNRSQSEARWDDECSICGTIGELLMCEYEGCNKTYHMHCLNLAATPEGTWHCPLHEQQMESTTEAEEAVVVKPKREPYKLKLKGPPSKRKKLATKV